MDSFTLVCNLWCWSQASKSQGIVNIMLTQLLEGDKIIVKGSLKRSRDMVYVDDAANAIIKSIFSNEARGKIINVGTGDPVTIDLLIRSLCKVLGRNYNDLNIKEEEGTIMIHFIILRTALKQKNSSIYSEIFTIAGFGKTCEKALRMK